MARDDIIDKLENKKIDLLQYNVFMQDLSNTQSPLDCEENSRIYKHAHQYKNAVGKATKMLEEGQMNGEEFIDKTRESQKVLELQCNQARREQNCNAIIY